MTSLLIIDPVRHNERALDWSEPVTNPWASDQVLLSLSIWWVKMTHPEADDFGSEVAGVFSDLQRDLQ